MKNTLVILNRMLVGFCAGYFGAQIFTGDATFITASVAILAFAVMIMQIIRGME